ncbi:hypothetical protein N0V90_010732 [Kalmusia sp. IMI 367209]|nr:hypothetical protein N0V90_010732 [Kalmusia sp. IMI 367209]
MPPALDRLLASPSALRLLRSIVSAPGPPTVCLHAAKCQSCTFPHRNYSSNESSRPLTPKKWRRWKQESCRLIGKENGTQGVQGESQIAHVGALAERLQQEERRRATDGICEVWTARSHLDLPTADTTEAEFLWGTFIKDSRLVIQVIDYAADLRARTAQVYPHLYELCMSYWLRQHQYPRQALAYHHHMRRKLHLQKLPLRHLARMNRERLTPKMYNVLMEIYQSSNETDLYDEVVPILCVRGLDVMAHRWHIACVLKGDLPSCETAALPKIQRFIAEDATSAHPRVRLTAAIAGSSRHGEPGMDQDLLRRLHGQDTAPVRFEDSFCARMFATRALPPESVIKGLSMVGVNEIGPLAVRAMASRTEPIYGLPDRFEELRAAGIALQGCVFSVALEKFAKEEQFALVRSMLESDQHPEVYDDGKLQKKLLDFYLEQQDWSQAHRTLAILSLFHKNKATEAWNLLLQAHIRRVEPEFIFRTLRNMAQEKVIVSRESILMLKGCLRHRRQTRKPVRVNAPRVDLKNFDDLRFVARMFIMILESGIGEIPPDQWREILRRYGMTGRVRELRRLVHWLFCWYAPRGSTLLTNIRKPKFLLPITEMLRTSNPTRTPDWNPLTSMSQTNRHHPLRQLFPNSFQQALIVWGFRAGLLPEAPTEQSIFSGPAAKKHFRRRLIRNGTLAPKDWSIGLRTLLELRHLNLLVTTNTVVKALQMVFLNLFGRKRPSTRDNRRMKAANTITYPEYVRTVNALWGRPLLPEPQLYGNSRTHALMWHPRFDRIVHRRSHIKLSDIVRSAKSREEGPAIHYVLQDDSGHGNTRLTSSEQEHVKLDTQFHQDVHDN